MEEDAEGSSSTNQNVSAGKSWKKFHRIKKLLSVSFYTKDCFNDQIKKKLSFFPLIGISDFKFHFRDLYFNLEVRIG